MKTIKTLFLLIKLFDKVFKKNLKLFIISVFIISSTGSFATNHHTVDRCHHPLSHFLEKINYFQAKSLEIYQQSIYD